MLYAFVVNLLHIGLSIAAALALYELRAITRKLSAIIVLLRVIAQAARPELRWLANEE